MWGTKRAQTGAFSPLADNSISLAEPAQRLRAIFLFASDATIAQRSSCSGLAARPARERRALSNQSASSVAACSVTIFDFPLFSGRFLTLSPGCHLRFPFHFLF